MSMQIKFNDDYNETTYYFGTLILPDRKDSGECRFTVSVVYFSNQGSWTINDILWEGDIIIPKEDIGKAEARITEMVMGWHGKKCDIDMAIELKDPKDRK